MTARLRTWTNAGQEHHALPATPEPRRTRSEVVQRLSGLLARVADELDALPEAERDQALSEAVLRVNTMDDERC